MGRRRTTLCFLLLAGCVHAVATSPPAKVPEPPKPQAPAPPTASCPRIERAPRMYSGFAQDVPSEAMVVALDVVVPLQNWLGALFCAESRADCRPYELRSIELADAIPTEAHVILGVDAAAPERQGELLLRHREGQWEADSESLEAYLRACRNARLLGPAAESRETSPREPREEPEKQKAAP